MPGAFTRAVHLTFSRSLRRLNAASEQAAALRAHRQVLRDEGLDWLQPLGAKIFMEPWCLRAVSGHLSTMRLRPCQPESNDQSLKTGLFG